MRIYYYYLTFLLTVDALPIMTSSTILAADLGIVPLSIHWNWADRPGSAAGIQKFYRNNPCHRQHWNP